jgi:hypothetical protein
MPDITIGERVDQFVTSPAGCALLLIVEERHLLPTDLAQPETAFLAAGAAIEALSPWIGNAPAWLKAEALRHGPRLRPLARAILDQAGIAWWWESLRHDAQLWTTQANHEPFPEAGRFPTPLDPPNGNERYAQHPDRAVYTSTAHGEHAATIALLLARI